MRRLMNLPVSGAFAVAFVSALAAAPASQQPIQSSLEPAGQKSSIVYKSTPQGDLKVDLYLPKEWKATDRRPAIVFFFGGGFTGGSMAQFARMAEYFASRGLVSATADYRVRSRHGTGADKSIEDARSAVRWLRLNAGRLGIDPQRIVAGGGSSGGTGAVLTAYSAAYIPEGEDQTVSDRPNALVLYNPAMGSGSQPLPLPDAQANAVEAVTSNWKVTEGGPPAILFFGTEDRLIERARGFTTQMIAAGNRAELYTAERQRHGFFNRPGTGQGTGHWHEAVVHQTDLFLVSLGFLNGNPTVKLPTAEVLKRALP